MVESRCTTDHYCLEMARGACVPARALACALPCIHLVLHALLVFSSIEQSVLVYKYISRVIYTTTFSLHDRLVGHRLSESLTVHLIGIARRAERKERA